MATDEARAEELLTAALDGAERSSGVAYLDTAPRPPGGVLDLGREKVAIDGPAFVAFVDARPGANWMHPARHLVIEPLTGSVRSFPTDRPPTFGPLPPSWKVAWQPGAIESWRLLPIAPTEEVPQ